MKEKESYTIVFNVTRPEKFQEFLNKIHEYHLDPKTSFSEIGAHPFCLSREDLSVCSICENSDTEEYD